MAERTKIITNAQAAEMRERCEAATPGEWGMGTAGLYFIGPAGENILGYSRVHDKPTTKEEEDILRADAWFIAHARTDMPKLLNEREELLRHLRSVVLHGDPNYLEEARAYLKAVRGEE